jgi:hypothetical protein
MVVLMLASLSLIPINTAALINSYQTAKYTGALGGEYLTQLFPAFACSRTDLSLCVKTDNSWSPQTSHNLDILLEFSLHTIAFSPPFEFHSQANFAPV